MLTNKLASKMLKLSSRDYTSVIKDMRERVKKDPTVQAKFKEYNIPLSEIDNVHVEFTELPVSAKTKNMKIYLNKKMLESDSNVSDPSAYLAHELIHFLQQKTGNIQGAEVKDYLEKPTEEEAFQVQIEYKADHEGEDEAEKYTEDLLDHHDYKGKERKEKKKELMDGI